MHTITQTLSAAEALAGQNQLPAGLHRLRTGLHDARAAAPSRDAWREAVEQCVRPHPLLPVFHENPFVQRCFAKPRGYAGDAVMLDFIYRHPANQPLTEQATERGRHLMKAALATPAPRAVRNRCRLLADEIDDVCFRNPEAEILSLACGHLREAEHSTALAEGCHGRFLALDQDGHSIATVQRDQGARGVTAQPGSVREILAHGLRDHGQFDFIYTAGLYDYLPDRAAARLLTTLYSMLKPGGKVWVANFVPDIADVGFMEAIMDWWLIYRDAAAMRQLAATALEGRADVAGVRTFHETEGNVVFLEAVKA